MFIPLTPIRFLHRAMDLYPNKIGVVCAGQEFTFSQFGKRCERLAAALPSHGVEPGDRVAYLSFNTHQLLEGYFGVPQAGAVLCPLNARLSGDELAGLLHHSGAKMLIFEEGFAPLISQLRTRCPNVTRFVGTDSTLEADLTYEDLLASGEPRRADIFSFDENSIAELFYTGGATGTPKGVMLSHRTLYLHALSAAVLARDPESAVDLYTIPLFHANGWGHAHIAAMLGIKQIMMRRFEPQQVFTMIERYGVTEMNLIPVMAHLLLQAAEGCATDRRSMRDIQIGGAPCSPQLIARMEWLFPNARCVSGYGMTETSPFLCYPPPRKTNAEEPSTRQARLASTGWPVIGASVRVVDKNLVEVAKDGVSVGEIVACGDNVMDGYFEEPAATASAVSSSWLRTGDLGVWDADGTIRFVDRSKDVIVRGGENISSLEIETFIYAHPSVLECAVVSAPDPLWGEAPIAIVVLKPHSILTEQDLLVFLRERLTGFKLPREIVFQTEPLPRSGTFKVLKMLLRDRYWGEYSVRVRG